MGRPRKYATASERQAAYRERYGVRQIRLRKETLATIDDIADQLDVPSTEVVASLINFALLNYNWRTLGLFGKRLPHASETRRENPIPRRPKTAGLMLEESQAKFSERFERLKNTDPAELIKAAEKTANSIAAHGQRGGTANSERGQQLIDRYEELREAILATERGVNAWNEWCKKRGYYAGHDAYDFFA